ncbi:MAG: NYN domain-containing protein [Planctomycetes bacterium]|nr:NYN domain-containing protein [Planctomycetota bacterium]
MILLIDGYNLLFSGLNLSDNIKPNQLETLRDNLVAQLKSYNIKKKYRIIVVFDGDKTVSHYPQERESGNVRVVFSPGRTTADEHIINLVSEYIQDKPRRSDVCAVTSDRALAETLRNKRVKIISSQEFAVELLLKDKDISTDIKEDPIEKFTGLKPADVPKWLKLFGTTDDTDSTD